MQEINLLKPTVRYGRRGFGRGRRASDELQPTTCDFPIGLVVGAALGAVLGIIGTYLLMLPTMPG